MSKITRFLSKVFGGTLTPSGNLTVIGSEAAGAVSYSDDPAAMQALSQFSGGWPACCIGNNSPSIQDMTALFFVCTKALQYLGQAGIPEWADDQTYYIGSFCQVDGVVYRSKTNDNLNKDPETETNDWENYANTIAPPSMVARAWVAFDGTGTPSIIASQGVASVIRIPGVATGGYRITFDGTFGTANYAALCSTGDQGNANADYCRVVSRTATYIDIYSTTTNSTRANSSYCNVAIYANVPLS